ncbi:MAG: hypothetical protein KAJ33_06970 [Thermoplasmata archaeon]|nr:hypothetical protein [Thermoplasmata archaeon]
MLYREEHAKKRLSLSRGAQNVEKEIEAYDSRGFVKIIQQGPYFEKIGLIIKQLESQSSQKWYLINVDGLEVGLSENAFEYNENKKSSK